MAITGKAAIGVIDVGWWCSACCLSDLHKITTKSELQQHIDDINNDWPLTYRYWKTKREAVTVLKNEDQDGGE